MIPHFDLTNGRDFEQFYLFYYPKLVRFSQEYVLSKGDAENIVQDVFLFIWEQRHSLGHIKSIHAYLFRLIKNKCVDFLRHKIMSEEKHQILQETWMREYEYNLLSMEHFDENSIEEENKDAQVQAAIQSLPEKCREIFLLSKVEGMSHQSIAEKFNISPSTVNNHINIAMKKLREKLSGYSFFMLFML